MTMLENEVGVGISPAMALLFVDFGATGTAGIAARAHIYICGWMGADSSIER